VIHEAEGRVLTIQSIDQSGIYSHPLSKRPIGGDPMRGTTTFRAAVELQNSSVPHITPGRALAPVERNVIAVIVSPEYSEPTADRAVALEHLGRLLRQSYRNSTAVAGCLVQHRRWHGAAFLSLLYELGLELHLAYAVDPAIDIVIAIDEPDSFYFGTHLYNKRCTLDLQILYDSYRITIQQDVTVRILDRQTVVLHLYFTCFPFVPTLGTHQHVAIFIGKTGVTAGAMW
jgi:hypothetical protein